MTHSDDLHLNIIGTINNCKAIILPAWNAYYYQPKAFFSQAQIEITANII
jgi:3-polyprenyl-4-hydroxybenzoate decarboxylase